MTFLTQVLPNGELLVGTGSGEVITVELGDVKKSNPGFANIIILHLSINISEY